MNPQHIEIFEGNSKTYTISVVDDNGNDVSLENYTSAVFTVRKKGDDKPCMEISGTISDSSITFQILKSVNTLKPAIYQFDCSLSNDDEFVTIAYGGLTIKDIASV